MKPQKYKKGEYGFLSQQKQQRILMFAGLAVVVCAVFVTGIILNKTRNNIFTVAAILLVLPTAKVLVNVIMLLRFKPTKREEYLKIQPFEVNNDILYDMVLSTPTEIIYSPIILIRDRDVILLTGNKIKDKDKCEKYIQGFARNDGIIIKVKMIKDENQMQKILESGKKSEKDVSDVVNILSILHI